MPNYNHIQDNTKYKTTLTFKSSTGETFDVDTEVVGNDDEALLEKGDDIIEAFPKDSNITYKLMSAKIAGEVVDLSDY